MADEARAGLLDDVTGRRAVFLDRDGVLNRAFVRRRRAGAAALGSGVRAAARASPRRAGLRGRRAGAGRRHQPARHRPRRARPGRARRHARRRLRAELPLDDVVVCPHDDDDGCSCRKPRPGMILDAARRLGLDLDRSVAVGDRWRDIDAAHRAGVAVRLDRLGARRTAPGRAGRTFWLSSRGTGSCPEGLRRRAAPEPARNDDRLGDHTREDLRRRRRPRKHHRPRGRPTDLGLHHEPDADAQGRRRRLRGVRPQGPRDHHRATRSRSRSSPTSRPRWCARPG